MIKEEYQNAQEIRNTFKIKILEECNTVFTIKLI